MTDHICALDEASQYPATGTTKETGTIIHRKTLQTCKHFSKTKLNLYFMRTQEKNRIDDFEC